MLRLADPKQSLTVSFFLTAAGVWLVAGGLAYLLVWTLGRTMAAQGGPFPPALWISTLLLIGGSFALWRGLYQVRRERQRLFRRNMLVALVLGTLFVGTQSFALACMLTATGAHEVQTGVSAFVFVAVVLHGLHFCLALLFLVFVTLQALADRYDHEYHWGVTVAAYFWHALGVVWLCILTVFLITAPIGPPNQEYFQPIRAPAEGAPRQKPVKRGMPTALRGHEEREAACQPKMPEERRFSLHAAITDTMPARAARSAKNGCRTPINIHSSGFGHETHHDNLADRRVVGDSSC